MEHITVKEILEATGGILLCGSINTPLNHISIDSRAMKEQSLFIPIIGEKVNAHNFIKQAIENGASAILTSEHSQMESEVPWIRVKDTFKALQEIGIYYRECLALPLVGVTGSVGKTTTREMIATALSASYKVYKTAENFNSQIGVPITLTEISEQEEIGVIELGMSEPDQLHIIAHMAKLHMAVITNIGIAHIEQLGSRKNIAKEKLSIQKGLLDGGIMILNGDDDILMAQKGKLDFKTIYYGTNESCDYRATDVIMNSSGLSFIATHEEKQVLVNLKVFGNHNVLNALAALAVAEEAGIPMEKVAKQLELFTGFKNRQQIYKNNGITIIDDTYNASPDSMKAGIEVLESMKVTGKRVAVLADMMELGDNSVKYHYQIGEFLSSKEISELVTIGNLSEHMAVAVKEMAPYIRVNSFSDNEEATTYLRSILRVGDAVLFKGSNSMKLNEISTKFIH